MRKSDWEKGWNGGIEEKEKNVSKMNERRGGEKPVKNGDGRNKKA